MQVLRPPTVVRGRALWFLVITDAPSTVGARQEVRFGAGATSPASMEMEMRSLLGLSASSLSFSGDAGVLSVNW